MTLSDRIPPRTLVISPNWIGDAVMAQPLLALLKAQQPDAAIDVVAPPWVAPVWRAMAEVDMVLEAPFRHGKLQLRERWHFARRILRPRGYEAAFVLPNTLKFALLPWLAGIARRIGYVGEMRYGLLNVLHRDGQPPRPMLPFYAALALAPSAELPASFASLRPAMAVDAQQAEQVLAKYAIADAGPIIVFAPGAEFGAAKRWPSASYAALALQIQRAHPNASILLLGSAKDRPVCEEIVAAAPMVRNLAGATSLDEAIALIAKAHAVVSNDSGLMHIAAALERPQVAVYGPTDPRHTPPHSALATVLWLHLPCAPCQQRDCPLGHHQCMKQISPEMVWQPLQQMVAAA